MDTLILGDSTAEQVFEPRFPGSLQPQLPTGYLNVILPLASLVTWCWLSNLAPSSALDLWKVFAERKKKAPLTFKSWALESENCKHFAPSLLGPTDGAFPWLVPFIPQSEPLLLGLVPTYSWGNGGIFLSRLVRNSSADYLSEPTVAWFTCSSHWTSLVLWGFACWLGVADLMTHFSPRVSCLCACAHGCVHVCRERTVDCEYTTLRIKNIDNDSYFCLTPWLKSCCYMLH